MQSVRLNKQSFTPLYHQIEQALREGIENGTLAPGHELSERELSQRFAVSRMTVRQALRALREEGLIAAERGRGTFVANLKLNVQTRQLLGFTEDMRRRGLKAGSRVISLRKFASDEALAKQLRLDAGDKVYEILRLRLADKIPMAFEICVIPAYLLPELRRTDVERGSLYQLFEKKHGISIGWADEILTAAVADKDEARLLSIQPRAPVLVVQRTVYTSDGTPLEVVRSVYRGDRYQAAIQLKRNGK